MLKHLLWLLLSLPTTLLAQHDFDSLYDASADFRQSFEEVQKTFALFGNEASLRITVVSDFKELNRRKDTLEYQDAVLEYVYNDSVVVHRDIGIKARGNYRRENCYYPPIKLNFPKKSVRLQWLRNFDKIKMVGICKSGDSYEQYLLSEYYVYRLFNILTDQSYRVRLLSVTYNDIGTKNKKRAVQTRHAFLIEPHEAVAERLNSEMLRAGNFPYDIFKPEEINLIAVFQYMIGNTDWSIPAQHNVKILKPKDPSMFLRTAVPYDFDYCGIVDPPYAIPSELLPIENIQQRLYRGPCRDFSEFPEILDRFRQKKSEFYALIQESPYLTDGTKKRMTNYMDSFYKVIDDPRKLRAELSVNCK
jgi:hypothetical protein